MPDKALRQKTNKAVNARLRADCKCVDCGRRTAALNDVGELQCHPCQRANREATEKAVATCGCGEPMITVAPMCGFCEMEAAAGTGGWR